MRASQRYPTRPFLCEQYLHIPYFSSLFTLFTQFSLYFSQKLIFGKVNITNLGSRHQCEYVLIRYFIPMYSRLEYAIVYFDFGPLTVVLW